MTDQRIFISYRRGDRQGSAGRLSDHLLHHFKREQVLMDVDSIEPGIDFVEWLDKQVATCSLFIAIIGPNWLSAQDGSGKRRLDDPSDYVRLEIESALKRDIRVIPVLVDGATMPQASELPPSLERLVRRNAMEIAHHRFMVDCDALAAAIKRALGIATEPVAAPVPTETPKLGASAGRLSWPEVLFSFRGRISRASFVVGYVTIFVVALAFLAVVLAVIQQILEGAGDTVSPIADKLQDALTNKMAGILGIVLAWPTAALTLKRLHDIGHGWVILLPFMALDITSTAFDLAGKGDWDNYLTLVWLGMTLMLAMTRGVSGPNEYGPEPPAWRPKKAPAPTAP